MRVQLAGGDVEALTRSQGRAGRGKRQPANSAAGKGQTAAECPGNGGTSGGGAKQRAAREAGFLFL